MQELTSMSHSFLERIAKGDKQAEEELVKRYWRGLYFIIHRRSNDPDLAADLAQDTFVIVINKARNGEIENPDALSAFIRQVGVNLLIAHYRKEERRATNTDSEIQSYIPDENPSLYRCLHSEKAFEFVKQLMEELKAERDREILKRYFVHEHDKVEICEALGLSAQHFDRVLYRARERLKQLIQFKFETSSKDESEVDYLNVLVVVFMVVSSQLPDTIESDADYFQKVVRDSYSPSHLVIQEANGSARNSGVLEEDKPFNS